MDNSPAPAGPPAEITHLVRERTEARARRDWARADALKAEIETAGWRVTDRGNRTSVGPAAPPTVELEGEVRYGSAAAVPSLLDLPATCLWTVVLIASEQPAQLASLLGALRTHAPSGTQAVVVANDPSDAQVAALSSDGPDRAPIGGLKPEVLRTSTRLGRSAALNIGLQRASGEFILLADASVRPTGDALTPLATALANPQIAIAGGCALYADEPGPLRPGALRREPAPETDASEAVALEGAWLAFRRDDYRELGPLDEHFVTPAWLDVWWSLRLRAGDEPEGAEYVESRDGAEGADGAEPAGVAEPAIQDDPADPAERTEAAQPEAFEPTDPEIVMPAPRRAMWVDLPLERDVVAWPPDRSRLNRRNMYRVLDRFGWRDDLT